ncbi:hypothetical protein [Pseudosulfitobacter pseudonitzschiae]|uniref:hypothetical protein n=1 Tax=Pseudosulfitobacter pseudonitzschiae TaxID=1402135 RepID=UPI001AF48184|nr:hypothetical protein [Pseudosulfitobacter pseudonitzschiae]MBM1814779.1 hypothetical protein [Pseudosulfitobacter pseudonitzschiae]MBM1831773.1 hypothetical protein [Pseudosulfitobacter pseudonitzschiae]MBM1836638.1 hypothetical protein [Pseudosulfitobacter pseudonitzschiae]MBM1841485.1 hypothetical protein [Pseudosulfitobacter pseudonitzschiae]MBM1846352.1 hypothetical protein [Pseudosulfitobacter pseudonitzschiae]
MARLFVRRLNNHTCLLLNDNSKLYLPTSAVMGLESLPQNAANGADFTPSEAGLFCSFFAVKTAIPTI